jgi:Domain of unknown function (DUF3471)
LRALSDNRFQLAAYPVAVTFSEATPAAPQHMTVSGPEEEKPDLFELAIQARPTSDQLKAYAGTYVSAEIDPVYRIVFENGGLVLKRLKSKPQKLEPTLQDSFQGLDGDIHFQRSSDGKITGFVLDSGRIKHFRFTKTAQML